MEHTTPPLTSMAFFNTSAKEIKEMQVIYDELAGSNPILREKLTRLMEWASAQGAYQKEYDNTDFSPN